MCSCLAVRPSALVTIGVLTKNSELVVMRACGISLYRTALPLVAFAIAASAVLFAIEEQVLAAANRNAARLKHIIRTGSPQTFGVLNRKWVVGRNGEVYHYQFYDPSRRELNSLSVFDFDETGAHDSFAPVRGQGDLRARRGTVGGGAELAPRPGLVARVRSEHRSEALRQVQRSHRRAGAGRLLRD